ncbi:MAG TPA: hypothetical protein DEA08_25145 [Planctomycetes bacterium]|nr:hypothetical protein [Planctomycetota bacterium]
MDREGLLLGMFMTVSGIAGACVMWRPLPSGTGSLGEHEGTFDRMRVKLLVLAIFFAVVGVAIVWESVSK